MNGKLKITRPSPDLNEGKKEEREGRTRGDWTRGSTNPGSGRGVTLPPLASPLHLPACMPACLPACLPAAHACWHFLLLLSSPLPLSPSRRPLPHPRSPPPLTPSIFSVARVASDGHSRVIDNIAAAPPPPVIAAAEARPTPGPGNAGFRLLAYIRWKVSFLSIFLSHKSPSLLLQPFFMRAFLCVYVRSLFCACACGFIIF
ncbi:hypothetical protein E2C01_083516 [Portunus trituberculatus]|uniref:Uncharacterized protein n=1 Tax=Portunus trituberculatus TaxID=210409 RepID=A0A5B7ISN5_PORTR|nr:hypothetical protein [Portunus trituberculatus]